MTVIDQQEYQRAIPQDIREAISKCLTHSTQDLNKVLKLLNNEQDPTKYLTHLKSNMANEQKFQLMLQDLVQYEEILHANPALCDLMIEIWTSYLEPSDKIDFEYGQKVDYLNSIFGDQKSLVLLNFLQGLSIIPAEKLVEIQKVIENSAYLLNGQVPEVFLQLADSALKLNKINTGNKFSNFLAIVQLMSEVYSSSQDWINDDISIARFGKIVIDKSVGMTAGIGGGYLGATIGTAILPGVGTVIGVILGGYFSSATAITVSDMKTQELLNLPKDVVLENAYRTLRLSYGASNNEINSNFLDLTIECLDGDYKGCPKLQQSMAFIKMSKEGI